MTNLIPVPNNLGHASYFIGFFAIYYGYKNSLDSNLELLRIADVSESITTKEIYYLYHYLLASSSTHSRLKEAETYQSISFFQSFLACFIPLS